MTRDLYLISVTLHVTAAVFWIGGMLFLGLVGAPLLRKEDPDTRRRLFHALGVRFRLLGWIAIAVLIVTGVLNAWQRGYLRGLDEAAFWGSSLGMAFGAKLVLVLGMLTLAALHDFWLGPLAGRVDPGSRRADRVRRATSWIARLNAVLALVLIYVAARLVRGG